MRKEQRNAEACRDDAGNIYEGAAESGLRGRQYNMCFPPYKSSCSDASVSLKNKSSSVWKNAMCTATIASHVVIFDM